VCALLTAAVLVVPSAASAAPLRGAPAPVARQASIAEGVATALATEVVKFGIKSAVAQWAPDLTKYVDVDPSWTINTVGTASGPAALYVSNGYIDAIFTK